MRTRIDRPRSRSGSPGRGSGSNFSDLLDRVSGSISSVLAAPAFALPAMVLLLGTLSMLSAMDAVGSPLASTAARAGGERSTEGTALDTGPSADPERTEITLLGTTDFHGYLLPWDYPHAEPAQGSLAQAATLVERIRAEEPNVVLVDSGDFIQGSELTDYVAAAGIDGVHPVVAAMNAMGYDAVAMGNHEYNHGLPFLYDALDDADFPVLSANTYRAGTDDPVHPPYVVAERGGVRIGIVGFNTPGVAIWDKDHVEGELRFVDIVDAARRWVAELRDQEDPDLVVVLAHSGIGPGSTYGEESGVPEEHAVGRLAREVEGIDVIFAGHSAGPVAGREIGGALVIHAGHRARHLAAVRVTLERESGSGGENAEGDRQDEGGNRGDGGDTAEGDAGWRVVEKTSSLLETGDLEPDPEVVAAVEPAHEKTLAWLEEEIGTTPERWSAAEARVRDTPVGDLITTAMSEAIGAEIASTPILDPAASFGPGPITRRDVFALYVYPNRLKSIRITGAQLRAYLEESARYFHRFPADDLVNDEVIAFNYDVVAGVDYRLDLTKPVGERVHDLRHDGEPVAPDDTFVMAINSYRQAGGGGFGMVTAAPVLERVDTLVSHLIVDYIQRQGTLRADDVFDRNWALEPEAAVRQLIESGATLPRF